ncbi:hypothetical protein L1887_25147 [Cichorium endivia]|nr:hypothetical protein L1887_25147 [Cichorium endivia]
MKLKSRKGTWCIRTETQANLFMNTSVKAKAINIDIVIPVTPSTPTIKSAIFVVLIEVGDSEIGKHPINQEAADTTDDGGHGRRRRPLDIDDYEKAEEKANILLIGEGDEEEARWVAGALAQPEQQRRFPVH